MTDDAMNDKREARPPKGSNNWFSELETDEFNCDCGRHHKIIRTSYTWPINAALTPSPVTPDDEAVDKFAAAMKEKMRLKAKQGRGGWQDKDQCAAEYLNQLLNEHIAKGDPVDVGNLAMMLFNRGERTESAFPVTPDASGLPEEIWVHEDYGGTYNGFWSKREYGSGTKYVRTPSSLAELEAENEKLKKRIEAGLIVAKQYEECRHDFCELMFKHTDLQAKLDKRTKALEESIQKLETYGFECEAGPLSLCNDWIELKGAVNGTNK